MSVFSCVLIFVQGAMVEVIHVISSARDKSGAMGTTQQFL